MTDVYSKDQIDQIGVVMATAINDSGEALKQFLQDEIDKLEPQPQPDSGGTDSGTASGAGAAGVFLDDGREIKQKLLTGNFGDGNSVSIPHGLIRSNIIDATIIIHHEYGYSFDPNMNKGSGQTVLKDWSIGDNTVDLADTHDPEATQLKNQDFTILIVYLA